MNPKITLAVKQWRRAVRLYDTHKNSYYALELQASERTHKAVVRDAISIVKDTPCPDTSSTSKPTGSSMT